MDRNKVRGREHALRIAVGITMLVLLLTDATTITATFEPMYYTNSIYSDVIHLER